MTGHNPTDRSKLGTTRHILTDKEGIPLSTFITSANTHDATVAIDTVDSMVIKRRQSYKLIDRNIGSKLSNILNFKIFNVIMLTIRLNLLKIKINN